MLVGRGGIFILHNRRIKDNFCFFAPHLPPPILFLPSPSSTLFRSSPDFVLLFSKTFFANYFRFQILGHTNAKNKADLFSSDRYNTDNLIFLKYLVKYLANIAM